MDYRAEAIRLVAQLGERMGPSAYDIAWMARLQGDVDHEARWPDLLDWLLEHQHADGSWGAGVVYYHDRIICTLAAAIALKKQGRSAATASAVRQAQDYVWHHLHRLSHDPFELVGFELIFPTLLATAQSIGLDMPAYTWGYGSLRAQKIGLIPADLLYSPKVSTVHSLEFLGRHADVGRLGAALAPNGSLGNSPATSAYYLLLAQQNPRVVDYLEGMRQRGIIYLYPFRHFELSWALNNLAFSGLPVRELAAPAVWEELYAEIQLAGMGLDPSFGIPDGDITSVVIRLLTEAGFSLDPAILGRFEDPERHIFRTYAYERNPSVGTNLHALQALQLLPEYPERRQVQERIIQLLLDQRVFGVYWVDKWHASPYYATAHVLTGLLQGDFFLAYFCEPAISWLVHTQRPDGSWGFFESGTAEETAYALTALLRYHRFRAVEAEVLHRAAAYLIQTEHGAGAIYPELWIGKCLYAPYDVVRAAILAALILYEQAFGRLR